MKDTLGLLEYKVFNQYIDIEDLDCHNSGIIASLTDKLAEDFGIGPLRVHNELTYIVAMAPPTGG